MHIESFTTGFEQPIITFNGGDKEAGRLWQVDGQLHFEGNVSECARMLFNDLVRLNNEYLSSLEEQNKKLRSKLVAYGLDENLANDN